MRKFSLINTLIAASLLTAGMAHAAETPAAPVTTTVNGGTIHFKGEVVNAACAVGAGSIDQTVQLGQVRTAALNAKDKVTAPVGFNIELNDCDTAVATKAAIAFSGVAVNGENPTALALEGTSSSGGAANVGIQVLDRTGKALAFDGATFGPQFTLNEGVNTIPFQVRYIATGVATAGTANANANFKVQYE
ncbi:type 1 fimbrial major subunit FimA [Erwinia sorbitola]|uniref:Fimbrial protein n=1 Tax=Erwinia sorbitola TaxID=2681984 RepID=A0A6I6EKQ5_9GAMM|nr:type 1 fimbrial major subunit FimA [Erwinia sorbitola]MTD29414.1 fimbrial protein [Erwinia sorbitola]QGU89168.1 fimbrial protein [Erwinia sorbitola]